MGMRALFRTAGVTSEQVVFARRCRVFGINPELTTTGTITLRDSATAGGANVIHVCAIGLTQVGKSLEGAVFYNGLTVQLSVGTDLTGVTYEAF
jgi:hypothetical protein